jgi:hypothetical protein
MMVLDLVKAAALATSLCGVTAELYPHTFYDVVSDRRGGGDFVRASTCAEIVIKAKLNAVDPYLAVAVAWGESHFNPHARSSCGAVGPLQALSTWRAEKRSGPMRFATDDPVLMGLKALSYYHWRHGDPVVAQCAYQGRGATRCRTGQNVVDRRHRLHRAHLLTFHETRGSDEGT